MVFTLVLSPGMLKWISSGTDGLSKAFACCMAALSVHWLPAAAMFVSQMSSPRLASDSLVVRLTTKVSDARTGPAHTARSTLRLTPPKD